MKYRLVKALRPVALMFLVMLFIAIVTSCTASVPSSIITGATPQIFDCTVIGTTEAGLTRLSCVLVDEATAVPTETATETPTETVTPSPTSTNTATPVNTEVGNIQPYQNAPLCTDHDNFSTFHTIWNYTQGCHYDHEHGQTPFTSAVANAFPGFDLKQLLGNVEIGHTNPSSPMENTHKHGGFKWQVDVAVPNGCTTGFESGTVAIDAYAVQFHDFGRQDVEFETSKHSTASLLRQCKSDNPSDKGYIYAVQLQEYGQRTAPYQGAVLPYPDNFVPVYLDSNGNGGFGPYFTTECFGTGLANCRASLSYYNNVYNRNNLSTWTSKRTGAGPRPEISSLFRILFRARDVYQSLDSSDLEYPFTWKFACGGDNYNPAGCRYNNSTATIHEIAGDIPTAWDNLDGFDTDPRVGRITADGFVTRFGTLNLECEQISADCYPIKLVSAFVGRYSSEVTAVKASGLNPSNAPERDIYFCNGTVCTETSTGAVPSGWIGSEN